MRRLGKSLRSLRTPKPSHIIFIGLFFVLAYFIIEYNAIEYILAHPFYYFQYPLETDMKSLVDRVMQNEPAGVDPITPFRYPVVFENDRLCKTEDGDDDSIFLLWVIKSKIDNFDQREAIRKTWGSENIIAFTPIRRIFLLGINSADRNIQQKVALEHRENHDIVQGYFEDGYFNNTKKLMMGFQWAVSKCKGARFIGFADDDFFISPFNVAENLKRVTQSDWENFVMGYIWDISMPLRLPQSKWYISLQEYPYRFWPPYPTAGCFFISMLAAERIQIAMQYTKYLRFDDVYVGIVAWKLGIPMKHNKNIYFSKDRFSGILRSHSKVLGVHDYTSPELIEAWDQYMKLKGDT